MTISRRHFIAGAATLAGAALTPDLLATPQQRPARHALRVNAQRLQQHLEGLSVFGRPAGGSFSDGVSRVGYSDADVAGRKYVMQWMRQAGLEPRIDPAGNILARRPGRDDSLPPILFGSHIDSVPNGGNFDGPVGSISALEVMHTLQEQKLQTRHPLEVVLWANEEGVAFEDGLDGSRAAAGKLLPGELDKVWNGMKRSDALRKIGGDPERIAAARRAPGSIHCYLELHIEQGGNLYQQKVPIAVVEGIVAIDRYEAVLRGFANHAGTTPMPGRRDALIAAARLILAVNEVARNEPGRQVGTVGQLSVTPNAPNVIPGVVRHTIELRDLSPEKLQRMARSIEARARQIAAESGVEIAIAPISKHQPALATPAVQRAIEQAADGLGLAHIRLPSGAGHDAQMAALLGPMGMIFVPSVDGISHSPRELTHWHDVVNGANVLLHTILRVDEQETLV